MLLAITKFELLDIRKALLASSKREEGYQSRLSEGLRVINAILDKKIEVVPANPVVIEDDEIEYLEDLSGLEGTEIISVIFDDMEEVNHGC